MPYLIIEENPIIGHRETLVKHKPRWKPFYIHEIGRYYRKVDLA
jgi:hypothetical protein